MLKIRLQRTGRRNEPTFRVVITDSKNSTKSGKYLEVLGSYDPRYDDKKTVNAERVKYWLDKGAKPSITLHNFLVDRKIIEGKKVNALKKKSPIKKEGEAQPASASPVAQNTDPKEKTSEQADASPSESASTPEEKGENTQNS